MLLLKCCYWPPEIFFECVDLEAHKGFRCILVYDYALEGHQNTNLKSKVEEGAESSNRSYKLVYHVPLYLLCCDVASYLLNVFFLVVIVQQN